MVSLSTLADYDGGDESLPVQWMWADASILGHKVARLNPARWSSVVSPAAAVQELEAARQRREQNDRRPVRLWIKGDEEVLGDVATAIRRLRSLEDAESNQVAQELDQTQGFTQPALDKGPPTETQPRAKRSSSFRYEVRSKIPDELLKGPFEDFEIACDVYSTAYVIARNATPEMYSIWPWRNPQVLPVWRYLFFIVASQLLVIIMITWLDPPSVSSRTLHVDCSNTTALSHLLATGLIAAPQTKQCVESGTFAFEADLRGKPVTYYRFEHSTAFYDAVLSEGTPMINLLRFICCLWQFSHFYFQHFSNTQALLRYHDFSRWFLPLKGETPCNGWAIAIPLVQYGVLLTITTISIAVLCAQTEAFDIVMNSLAFTFIAEVGSYFNSPLAEQMSKTNIRPPPYDDPNIAYLYPEYLESNAINEDGTYTDEGWYLHMDEAGKAGLLSDYKVRHNPDAYEHASERLIVFLDWLLLTLPFTIVLLLGARCRGGPFVMHTTEL